jgi:hypothetical protein
VETVAYSIGPLQEVVLKPASGAPRTAKSIVSCDKSAAARLLRFDNSFAKLLEKPAWKHSVNIGAIWPRPKIVAWPRKAVQLVEPDPMARSV